MRGDSTDDFRREQETAFHRAAFFFLPNRDRIRRIETARAQLPATRDDIARLQEQLDRIEASLAELAGRVDAPKPRRAKPSGSAKAEG